MKGFVFTEFLEMVEDKFGFDIADRIIDEKSLSSKGVYSAVGTYNHQEMFTLVANLSKETGIPARELLHTYGKYLFTIFRKNYGVFFKDVSCSFDFLERVDSYIHIEVKKLYPEAELPSFEIFRDDDKISMLYKSSRKMSDFAVGLIEGCMEHYGDEGNIVQQFLDDSGKKVQIKVEKRRHGKPKVLTANS